MKSVLVTGADGFIGSHLAETLIKRGYSVRALALYNSFNSWGWLDESPLAKDMEIVTGDIRDPGFCRQITKGVDTVFNLAALIAIPYSYAAPESYVQTNVIGTSNVCLAARDSGCARIVHTSTSEVYGTARTVPISEEHPLQPQSPYSASKIGADAMAMSYFNAFQLPVTIARPFNTYGPRQSARAIIPTLISQIAAGLKEIKVGDLRPTRDLNFVSDTCNGMIKLAEASEAVGRTVNIGSNTEISIKDLFLKIREMMDSKAEFVDDPARHRPANSEVFQLRCDNTLIKQLTGFCSEVSLDEGLKQTIAWFRDPANLKKYKTGIYNV